jgi:hypothetical protein
MAGNVSVWLGQHMHVESAVHTFQALETVTDMSWLVTGRRPHVLCHVKADARREYCGKLFVRMIDRPSIEKALLTDAPRAGRARGEATGALVANLTTLRPALALRVAEYILVHMLQQVRVCSWMVMGTFLMHIELAEGAALVGRTFWNA